MSQSSFETAEDSDQSSWSDDKSDTSSGSASVWESDSVRNKSAEKMSMKPELGQGGNAGGDVPKVNKKDEHMEPDGQTNLEKALKEGVFDYCTEVRVFTKGKPCPMPMEYEDDERCKMAAQSSAMNCADRDVQSVLLRVKALLNELERVSVEPFHAGQNGKMVAKFVDIMKAIQETDMDGAGVDAKPESVHMMWPKDNDEGQLHIQLVLLPGRKKMKAEQVDSASDKARIRTTSETVVGNEGLAVVGQSKSGSASVGKKTKKNGHKKKEVASVPAVIQSTPAAASNTPCGCGKMQGGKVMGPVSKDAPKCSDRVLAALFGKKARHI